MWFDPFMTSLLRSPLHGLLSGNTMLITVPGRKSGRAITTPVNYVRCGDDLLLVSFRSRRWWRNLRGRQTPVELLLAGRRRQALAAVSETDAEVAAGLGDMVAALPALARPLGIGLDGAGRPKTEDLDEAARSRVIVRARLH